MHIKDQTQAMSVDVQVLLNRLRASQVGEIITYEELKNLVDRDVQRTHRHLLSCARKHAKRERIVFGVITNKGIQRLDDAGKVRAGSSLISTIRRTSKRAAQTLATVENFDQLPNDVKIQHNMALSIFGIVQQSTSKTAQTKVAAKIDNMGGGVLAMRKSLELFT